MIDDSKTNTIVVSGDFKVNFTALTEIIIIFFSYFMFWLFASSDLQQIV